MIRDTTLHDDIGGAGQRIYTTAGQGYEKREYIRSDLAGPAAPDEVVQLRNEVRRLQHLYEMASRGRREFQELLREMLARAQRIP